MGEGPPAGPVLEPTLEISPSPDPAVRPATADDYADFLRLFPELGLTEAPATAARFAAELLPDTLVLMQAGRVAGLIWACRRGALLHVVYVITDPALRGLGLGRRLMGAAAARGRQQGYEAWTLNVQRENTVARAMYASMGLAEQLDCAVLRLPWAAVEGLPEAAPGLRCGPLPPEVLIAPAVLSARMSWSELGALPGRGWWVATRAEHTVGRAGFAGAAPQSGVFRTREAGVARALLLALRARCAPTAPTLTLLVADDLALELALVRAGAALSMQTIRLEGPLPGASPGGTLV